MADVMLEKVDILRKRCRLSYREAYDLLERHGGNVIQALIAVEDGEQGAGMARMVEERVSVMGHELLGKVTEIIKTGQTSRIRLARGGRTLLTVPTAVGAVGAMIFPFLTVVATAAAVAARYELILDKRTDASLREDGVKHVPGLVNVHHEEKDDIANAAPVVPSVSSGKEASMAAH
jgi:hypothetical protein